MKQVSLKRDKHQANKYFMILNTESTKSQKNTEEDEVNDLELMKVR